MPTEFPKPELPVILTSKDWDKKKGVFAKMHGKTGIGEQMDKVLAAYNDVAWDKINMVTHQMRWGDVTKKAWDKVLDDAKAEVTGNLAKFSQSLYTLRDLAKKTAEEFKKSKTIPSASVKHVQQVADTADQLGLQMSKNSMSEPLRKMYEEFLEHIDKNMIKTFYSGLKKYLQIHAGTIDQLKAQPTFDNFNELGCRKGARDFATALGNIAKAHDKGFEAKNPGVADQLYKAITPYANLNVVLMPETKREEVLAEIAKLEKLFRAVQLYANSLP
jgi:hypothetical protein